MNNKRYIRRFMESEIKYTTQEKKLIRNVYIKHKLKTWLFITLVPVMIIGGGGMLAMDSSFGEGAEKSFLLSAWIGILAFCIIWIIYTAVSCKSLIHKDAWSEILQKSEYKCGDNRSSPVAKQAELLANTFYIKLPDVKKIGFMIMILVCAATIGALTYSWQYNEEIRNAENNIIKSKMAEIDRVFVSHGGRTHRLMGNEKEGIPASVRGYAEEDGYEAFVSFTIQPGGKISGVEYCMRADTSLSKETAYKNMQKEYKTLHRIVADIEMDKSLKKNYPLSEKFKADFFSEDEWFPFIDEEKSDKDNRVLKYYILKDNDKLTAKATFDTEKDLSEGRLWIIIETKERKE